MSIFEEVDEELRRDRMEQLWRKYAPLLIGAAILIVLGTAAGVGWRAWQSERNISQTGILHAAVGAGEDRVAALSEAVEALDGHHRIAARLHLAAARMEAEDQAGALATLEAAASDDEAAMLWRDLARLSWVRFGLDSLEPDVLEETLVPLSADSNPWRHSARELQALVALRRGDRGQAAELFAALAADSEAPSSLRERSAILAERLGG